MPSVKIRFKNRSIRPRRHRFGVRFDCPPKVHDEVIDVVCRFNAIAARKMLCGPAEQCCQRSHERLDVVIDFAESLPDKIRDFGLPAWIGEW